MRTRSGRRGRWATAVAHVGQAHWFFGNLYEAVVDVPALLADARPRRTPGVLTQGSPLRYYAPVAPVTLAATAVAVVENWRSGNGRAAAATATASTAAALAVTAWMVRTVSLRLLNGQEELSAVQRRALLRAWHRGNAARLLALTVAAGTLRRGTPS